ncbi:MAG: polysaccharide deacetylase family protein [Bacteroidota bacterium]|nr:polysaccharide deacetylase family protein [Bacteroidota bacterium]
MFLRKILLLLVATATVAIIHAQTIELTYAEKLGYPKGAKVLILHVDDAGMSYDSNEGTIQALTNGVANSCSVMMPCSWVPGFVHFLKQHPGTDAGLHLTLTSEWKEYRWGPIAGKSITPGLVDHEGNLWPSVPEVVMHASAGEVEKEIKAQLDRARTMGFEPTHLDSHMGTLFASPAFLEKYIKLGIDNHIPVMLPGGNDVLIQQEMQASDTMIKQLRSIGRILWSAGLPVLDDLHNYSYDWEIPDSISNDNKKLQDFKTTKYIGALQSLQAGVTMMIMHCTATSETFKYISSSGASRRADLLAMLDPAFKKALKDNGIILSTWRELKERRMKVKD